MQDFMHFMLSCRKILPNCRRRTRQGTAEQKAAEPTGQHPRSHLTVDEILTSSEVSQEIKNYYNAEVQTKLPDQLGKRAPK